MRQTFHNGALYPILQSVRVNCDNYITHFYKPSYDVDSSLDVIRVLRYPFSLLETYHRDSDRSDRSFYTNQHYREQVRSEEHTSELQSRFDLVCRLLLEKKKEHDVHERRRGVQHRHPRHEHHSR